MKPMDNSYISDILERMRIKPSKEGGAEEKNSSFLAHREAAEISDSEVIPLLESSLQSEKDKYTRGSIYFILGQVGKNTSDIRAANLLLKCLTEEKDKYCLSVILNSLAVVPELPNSTLIEELAKDKRWLVRHSAISALQNSRSEESENLLISILQMSEDTFDIIYANAALGKAGTKKAISHLLQMTRHKSRDVKMSAVLAAINIAERENYPLTATLIELIQNESSVSITWPVMGALNKLDDKTAISAVCKRIRNIVSKKRGIQQIPRSELMEGCEFLSRHSENLEALHVFAIVRSKWCKLFDYEQEWLCTNVAFFAEMR